MEAGRASVSSLALKDVLRRAMQAVRDLFQASGVAIWRLDEGGAVDPDPDRAGVVTKTPEGVLP